MSKHKGVRFGPRVCENRSRLSGHIIAERRAATAVTVLEPSVRERVDAATNGAFRIVHAGTVAEAAQAVREYSPAALLLSPAAVRFESRSSIAGLVARCPGAMPAAVVADATPDEGLLVLGACGVRRLIYVSEPDGLAKLRALADNAGGDATAVIQEAVTRALESPAGDALSFFGQLTRSAVRTPTAKEFAGQLGVRPSTLNARFFRLGLPTPKDYLCLMRIVYAAAFFEKAGVSVAGVANGLGFSSPQSFSRTIRVVLGITAGQFRQDYCFAGALDYFVSRLIIPHQETFKTARLLA